MFSNSKEGMLIRERQRGSPPSRSECSRADSISDVKDVITTQPPELKRQKPQANKPKSLDKLEGVAINPEGMCYETSLLFYNQSKTLRSCLLAISDPVEIEAFVMLSFSERRKSESAKKSVCKFTKGYYDFQRHVYQPRL